MQASEPNADEIDVPAAVDLHRDLQACTLGTYTGCTTAGAAGNAQCKHRFWYMFSCWKCRIVSTKFLNGCATQTFANTVHYF
jgi:hypothetical protein